MKRLTAAEREFLRDVERAAFANPFSESREAVDRLIGGAAAGADETERVGRVTQVVSARLASLERARGGDGADDALLAVALLFDTFHRFIPSLDAAIEQQVAAGPEPARIDFAPDVLALLARRGFSHIESLHFFAIFFQLRRAFYFISRGLTGSSPCMRAFRERLWHNVFTRDIRWYERHLSDRMEDFSTLLLGETGTGKGAAAAAIGRSGLIPFDEKRGVFAESFNRTFIAVNLSQYAESLVESELFGHRKGAFTGAIDHHEGVFARCSPHGAIFLDEIGEVPATLQIKLLKVLQDRVFSPVGSHREAPFRGRVIAATNRPLDALRRAGRFRDDFYYRLCSDVIEVPTLRRRIAEAPRELDDLVERIVQRLSGGDTASLAADVLARLRRSVPPDYAWPGNVRELEQAVRRVLLTGAYAPASPAPEDADAAALARRMRDGAFDAPGLLAAYCRLLHDRLGTYEAVARRTRLDRRTVRKYIVREPAEAGDTT